MIRRARSWLGLERNILVLLAAILLLGTGEELWGRFIPLYLQALGATAWVIALYGTLKDLLDALYAYPGGWLADRLGRRNALTLFALLAVIGYAIYALSPSSAWILVGTLFVMAWSSLTLPAVFAVIGDSLPGGKRATGFGVQSILKRIPIVIGPPLGGWLIARSGIESGVRLALVMTMALGLAAVAVVRRSYSEPDVQRSAQLPFAQIWRGLDARLKRLLVVDCLARWAEGLPKVFVILYVIDILGGTVTGYGWLVSLQMVTATVTYIPIANLADRLNRKPFVLLTFIFFALFPLMLAVSTNLAWVALAFVLAGLREVGEPARKALIVDLTLPEIRGRQVGLYYLVRGLVVFPASLVGGWLWTVEPVLPFYAAFAIGALGAALYALRGVSDMGSFRGA